MLPSVFRIKGILRLLIVQYQHGLCCTGPEAALILGPELGRKLGRPAEFVSQSVSQSGAWRCALSKVNEALNVCASATYSFSCFVLQL